MTKKGLFLLFLGAFLLPPPAHARTWLVSKTDPRGVQSFNNLDAASLQPGDTVVVRTGVYKETLNAIQGIRYLARGEVFVDHISIDNVYGVTIDGFRQDTRNEVKGIGLSIFDAKQIKVRNCRIRGYEGGVSISRSSGVELDKVFIDDSPRGLAIYFSDNVKFERSLIGNPFPDLTDNNGAIGIEVSSSKNLVFDHNTVVGNGGAALIAGFGDRIKFTNNIVAFNGWGLGIEHKGRNLFDHNVFYGNRKGNQRPPEDKSVTLPLTKGVNFSFNPGFVDQHNRDWRLLEKAQAAFSDTKGSYLGAFPPLPPE